MFLGLLGPDTSREMIVEVTVGIPKPEAVNEEEVLSVLPHGKGVLKTVQGGLEIEPREGSGDKTIMRMPRWSLRLTFPRRRFNCSLEGR